MNFALKPIKQQYNTQNVLLVNITQKFIILRSVKEKQSESSFYRKNA